MRVHVYTICWNESRVIEYFLRHYEQFAERVVVYDENSTDGTKEILAAHRQQARTIWHRVGAVGDRNFTNSCGATRSGSSKMGKSDNGTDAG
jgi:hypothetical protein